MSLRYRATRMVVLLSALALTAFTLTPISATAASIEKMFRFEEPAGFYGAYNGDASDSAGGES